MAFAGWGILMGIQKIEENGLRLLTIFLYCHSNAKEYDYQYVSAVWLFCCLVVLLSGRFVDCIVYTFNKITKPLNDKTTTLNIDILWASD